MPSPLSCVIITLSDRASQGIYDDVSGKELAEQLKAFMESKNLVCSIHRIIIPDNITQLQTSFKNATNNKTDFIFTTGGTGIGSSDITPDVIKPLLTKEIPGIMEVIRVKYGMQFPAAALSRSIAGVSGHSLVYCLPGSPKAVREYMDEILKTLIHCRNMLDGGAHKD